MHKLHASYKSISIRREANKRHLSHIEVNITINQKLLFGFLNHFKIKNLKKVLTQVCGILKLTSKTQPNESL